MVNNKDGLFNGNYLPIRKTYGKKPRRYLPFLTPAQKLQIKLDRAKLKQSQADQEVIQLQKLVMKQDSTPTPKPAMDSENQNVSTIVTTNGRTIQMKSQPLDPKKE